MPSIFSLAPTTPVNRGLAAEVSPLYPEKIALLQQVRTSKAAKAASDRAIRVENYDYSEKKKIDPEGLDTDQLKMGMETYNEIMVGFSKDVDKNLDPAYSGENKYREQLNDLANWVTRTKASGIVAANILSGASSGGDYWWLDEDLTRDGVIVERDRVKNSLQIANFDDIVENPEYFSLNNLQKNFNENQALTYEQEWSEITIDGSDESVLRLQNLIKGDVWERNDDGSYVYDNGDRVIKSTPPDSFLERVRSDDKYFSVIKRDASKNNLSWQEFSWQKFLETSDISQIEKSIRTTAPPIDRAGGVERQEATKFLRQVYKAMVPGSKTAKTIMATLGGGGVSYTQEGSKVKVSVTKTYLDSMDKTELLLVGKMMGIKIGKEGEDVEALRELMKKHVVSGSVDIFIDLGADYRAGIIDMIKLSKNKFKIDQLSAMFETVQNLPEVDYNKKTKTKKSILDKNEAAFDFSRYLTPSDKK